ncbi:polysaccharide biosynthesis/export family protein [Leptolyngbya sp. CCNP1308]|uniref:polysaccharide biosynthesis/export family protein n=1 Tax=Leptolyngbya sp. CCNP1308 TaxID=3110255 RepID=UPI002B1FD8DD|nr:polysaccharide biosynthesis/export family protein [Leptolyngbya sp. CCNP1308]MEA5449353.1 polysaccharide biosynthesis/export family protein [Leptolyngbya sp. CCNP1308]
MKAHSIAQSSQIMALALALMATDSSWVGAIAPVYALEGRETVTHLIAQEPQPEEGLPLSPPSGSDQPRRSEAQPVSTTVAPGGDLFSDYLLGPGDQISMDIIGYEAFDWASSQRFVLSDGSIRLPLVGTVVAAGKTLEALEIEVRSLLSRELVSPRVDMSLTVLRPVVVNVVGDVYRPGPVQLGSLTQAQTNIASGNSLTTTTTTPTLTAALAAAGGIRRTADIRQVVVKRRIASGETRDYAINLWSALIGQDNLGVLVMFDGDVVYVPKADTATEIDQALLASSSIAPTNVRVRVIGEGVVNPGEVQVQPNSSISGAIAAAGGPNADAALGDVRLVRLSSSGQVEDQQVDLSSLVDSYQIQDGDVILVPKRGYLVGIDNINRALGPILSPLSGFLGILNIFGLFNND